MEKDWDKKPNQLVVLFMTFTSGYPQPWPRSGFVLKGLQ
jgi:hypothetical protein